MINKAIAKITNEMMRAHSPAIQSIEEHLTGICTTDEIAERILADGKTLAGALKQIENEARKNTHGNTACVSDAEGFRIVDKYFGITEDLIGKKTPKPQKKEHKSVLDFI